MWDKISTSDKINKGLVLRLQKELKLFRKGQRTQFLKREKERYRWAIHRKLK